jgi:hypothetical protein
MRVTHLTLPVAVQTINGQLRGSLTAGEQTGGGYEMYFLSRLGLIEVSRPEWKRGPAYISVQGCVFSTEEPLRKT